MCGRISQMTATLYLRDRANIQIAGLDGSKSGAIWEGHIRDDNRYTKNSMQRVIIPKVTEIDHHGHVLHGEFDLIGWTRLIDGTLRVWIETEDADYAGRKDRWPKFMKCNITAIDKPLPPQ